MGNEGVQEDEVQEVDNVDDDLVDEGDGQRNIWQGHDAESDIQDFECSLNSERDDGEVATNQDSTHRAETDVH